jgi:hypothetical protein
MHAITIGRTGNSEYKLKGRRVYRRLGTIVNYYDDLQGFVDELLVGAMGPGWRETPVGKVVIDRVLHEELTKR